MPYHKELVGPSEQRSEVHSRSCPFYRQEEKLLSKAIFLNCWFKLIPRQSDSRVQAFKQESLSLVFLLCK